MTVRQAVESILTYSVGERRLERTCDQLISGSWDSEVAGIAVTFMATVDVIRKAKELGANLIVTHEPTWFTGADSEDWCAKDSVYLAKRRLIEETGVSIWRFHDHMHMSEGDLIYKGMQNKLGWEKYLVEGQKAPWMYDLPAQTLRSLVETLKKTLEMDSIQVIGDPNMQVSRMLLLVGGGSLGLGVEQMPMIQMELGECDVMLCGDITEWTTCAYVRDASQLGMTKALVKLGHERSEEAGMEYMAQWLPGVLEHKVPVTFIDSREPFRYL